VEIAIFEDQAAEVEEFNVDDGLEIVSDTEFFNDDAFDKFFTTTFKKVNQILVILNFKL